MQEGIVATPRVLAVLAQVPDIESNEPAQAVLADVVAVLLDGCERGELAGVISVFADCPPALAKMALALLTAAFFPDGKIVPAEFDDSAILCFSLFVAVAGQPADALDLIGLTVKERKGERFAANAALLRAHIEKGPGGGLPLSQRERVSEAERNAIVLQVRQHEARRREAAVNKQPKVHLAEKHMRNCALLLDRGQLLTKLPRGGTVAELGVDRGDFSARILELTQPTRLHLVDLWGSERYHGGLFDSVKQRFGTEIADGRVQVHRKMSVDAADDFADASFDWIYIDTDHSYETTARELRRFASKIKDGGLIAGHDYCMGNWANGYRYGVIEAVHEFCVKENWELVYLTAEPLESQSFAIRRIRQDAGEYESAKPATTPRALIYMTARNCERYVSDSLRSLASQTHDNLHVLFIDDASDDATGNIASGLLEELFPGRHSFIRNDSHWGKARNAHVHLRALASDATFVAILDGDDHLIVPDILARVAEQYALGTDVVWTNYVTDQNKVGHCGPLDPRRSPRHQGWKSSHLFTFRAELLANVGENYFKDESGAWFMSACDWAIAYPILDQTRRYHYIPESTYRYTTSNPHSHHNSDPDNPPQAGKFTSALQKHNAKQVLNKSPLPCLRDLPQEASRPVPPKEVRPTTSEPPELEKARAWLTQEGLVATPRVLAVLAQVPVIEANESTQAMLVDVIAVLLDGCERGEFASVISVFANCPPALAKMALTLLTAAFFPDGKIIPTEFDDSAVLCFSLFVAVAGKPFEAMELIDLTAKERKGERFSADAALLRAYVADLKMEDMSDFRGFFINLDRSADRKNALESTLERLGLNGVVKRFPAMEGDSRPSAISPNELGCFLSHQRVIETADPERHLLVFEDDVWFPAQFQRYFQIAQRLMANDTWDMVFLNMSVNFLQVSRVQRLIRAKRQLGDIHTPAFSQFGLNDARGLYDFGMMAYVVRKGAQAKIGAILAEAAHGGYQQPIDNVIGAAIRTGRIKASILFPYIVGIDQSLSVAISDRKKRNLLFNDIVNLFVAGVDTQALTARAVAGAHDEPFDVDAYVQSQLVYRWLANA
ncbi:glycosyltransferase [Thermomonas brevis]|uniref:Glycosyltransferase n=1 Tax=Thermomonas brevis TaxID=215691 RepID=A0A7G9QTN9_9GAMM|nr:glycosyltransferase [Thermomonas brevis]QNN46714.1 glycosyltransferase [Thermomonas brevis]